MLHARGGSRELSHSHRRPHCWRLTLPAGMVPRARHPASKRHDLCLEGAGCTCGLHPKEVSIRGKPCVVGVLLELLPGHSTPPSKPWGASPGQAADAPACTPPGRRDLSLRRLEQACLGPGPAGLCVTVWREVVSAAREAPGRLLASSVLALGCHTSFTPSEACNWYCFPLGSVPTSFLAFLH